MNDASLTIVQGRCHPGGMPRLTLPRGMSRALVRPSFPLHKHPSTTTLCPHTGNTLDQGLLTTASIGVPSKWE